LASFNYVVVTHDGSTARIWLNGAEDLPAMSLAQTETAMGFGVGFHLADDFFDGIIDEARVSNVLRSDAWTSAQHESMTNAFHTLGTEESVP